MKPELLRSIRHVGLLIAITLTSFCALPAQAQTIGYGWLQEQNSYYFPVGPIQPSDIEGGLWSSEASALAGLTAWSGAIAGGCSTTTQDYWWAPTQAWGATIANEREYVEYYESPPACTPMPVGSLSVFWLKRVSYTSPYTTSLVDPATSVPSEVGASGVDPDAAGLAAISSTVAGVAADGAAEIVMRIAAPAAGTSIQLTLTDENGNPATAGSQSALGYLTTLLASDPPASTAQGQPITVTTVPIAGGGGMAFAVYYTPRDFVRDGNTTDSTLSNRPVFVETGVGGTVQTAQEIEIVRPPAVFIHGLWGSPFDGDNIMASLTNDGVGLKAYAVGYNGSVTVLYSTPSYGSGAVTVSGANLGLSYAASIALPALNNAIADYRTDNTLGQPIAVARADMIGHSMGGDVVRYLPLAANFAQYTNYNLGPVHKLITIGTPHLGSPLAIDLLNASNECLAKVLSWIGQYAFSSVEASPGVPYDGAIADIEGDLSGTLGSLGPGLYAIQPGTSSITVSIPTAMIAGLMTSAQLNTLNTSKYTKAIRVACGSAPLAIDLTPSGWPGILGNQSDAIVPLNSQIEGRPSAAFPPGGEVHSPGTEYLGFAGPSELDDMAVIAPEVLQLLNTPVDNSAVYLQLP